MIVYNGIALESIAPVKIEDIRVSPIQLNPVVRPRAIRFGSEFVRMGGGTRSVAITFALLDENKITRHESLLNISQWAKTDKEYKLELPTDPLRYLTAVCTAKPEPSTRQWWESNLRLVFTCYDDPYWIAKGEKTIACGTLFTVLGDAPPKMRIVRTLSADATNQSYGLNGDTISFSTIPAGDMEIDLERQTATVNNVSIMQYYNTNGRFLIPATGSQILTGTGTVKYKERWA